METLLPSGRGYGSRMMGCRPCHSSHLYEHAQRSVGLSTGLKKEKKRVVKIELQIAAFWVKVVKDKTDSSGGFILKFLSCKIMCCKRRFVLLVLTTGHFKIFLDGKKKKKAQ